MQTMRNLSRSNDFAVYRLKQPAVCIMMSLVISMMVTSPSTDVHAFVPTTITLHSTRTRLVFLSTFTPPPPPLIPEENPEFDPAAKSLAGVSYNDVLAGLHRLYPPSDLESRNALSRTDGYWPYIQRGEDPPSQLTYGEFDFYFFAQLLDKARSLLFEEDQAGDLTFYDIGSGTGRLALAAAALHPDFKSCRGIELLPTIHEAALEKLKQCQTATSDDDSVHQFALRNTDNDGSAALSMAPIELVCGSFEDPYIYIGDANIIFCFAACMGDGPLPKLAESIGRQCKPGTLVITTEFMLPLSGDISTVESDDRVPGGEAFALELVERIEGWCWLTGGASTAFIHRVTKSLWRPDQGPLNRPIKTLQDIAFEAAREADATKEKNYLIFLRGVSNDMAFHDFPESWRPDL